MTALGVVLLADGIVACALLARSIVEADRVQDVTPDVAPPPVVMAWPRRQTPTDLWAAYEDTMPAWPWPAADLDPAPLAAVIAIGRPPARAERRAA